MVEGVVFRYIMSMNLLHSTCSKVCLLDGLQGAVFHLSNPGFIARHEVNLSQLLKCLQARGAQFGPGLRRGAVQVA